MNAIRQLATFVANVYIQFCFRIAKQNNKNSKRTLYFSRGTFEGDIRLMKKKGDIILNANHLRRIFNLIATPHQLEQIVCIHYADLLQKNFAAVIKNLEKEIEKSNTTKVCFGGIDYFEVAIFGKALAESKTETIAIFHENYTIPLVMRQTENIIRSYPEIPQFSSVHAIGLPAMTILKQLYKDVRPHAFPRFKYSTNCTEFSNDVCFIPFSTITYFAPVAASITYAMLADLSNSKATKILVKHKNKTEEKNFIKSHGKLKNFRHTTTPSAADICAKTRMIVCFNSLVYYEALAHGHLIALPEIAEAKLGEPYSQHTDLSPQEDAGIRYFSSASDLEKIFEEAQSITPTARLQWTEARKRMLEQSFYCQQ